MVKRTRDSSIASSAHDKAASSADEGAGSPRPAKLNAVTMSDPSAPKAGMQCSLPPHRETLGFASIEDFEVHYIKDHSNRCTSCGKNFPTAHFLALHIDENHNTFREALQATGEKTYSCFVEDCDKKCSTPQKRRLHLIDKHLFPKIYNFRIVDTGVDKSTSMLHEGRRRRVSTATDQSQSNSPQRRQSRIAPISYRQTPVTILPEQNPEDASRRVPQQDENDNLKSSKTVSDTAINDLEVSMSALRFVPPSVANKQRNRLTQV